MKKNDKIKVVELFAGVGGFRVGLEKSSTNFEVVWANQWEPNKKQQHAFDCYVAHFGESKNHVNENISEVKNDVPKHDMLVGGFPCQDYSVAQTGAKGIEGKKGVLWWEIRDIIENKKPKYVLLENVDRLIKSPAQQRGRDFGIILRCFDDLGYAVEWRVINAADYGNHQKRRRIFIFAYKKTTKLYKKLAKSAKMEQGLLKWMIKEGFYASAFPLQNEENPKKRTIIDIRTSYKSLKDVSEQFKSEFYNSGVMIDGIVYSEEFRPETQPIKTLREIRQVGDIDQRYFLNGSTEKWLYLKGPKKINRLKPNGDPYVYSEGGMSFPDDLDKPSRTMLTSEASLNRSTHVIEDEKTGMLRLLTPVECEMLNGFSPNWTNTGMPHKFRYFTMGNALVVPIITRIGNRVMEIEKED